MEHVNGAPKVFCAVCDSEMFLERKLGCQNVFYARCDKCDRERDLMKFTIEEFDTMTTNMGIKLNKVMERIEWLGSDLRCIQVLLEEDDEEDHS